MTEAPEKIVASVHWENINGHRVRLGCVTVGTDGVPSPFYPAHYIRKDVSDALVAAAREEALREAAAVSKEIADQYVGYMSRIEQAILALAQKDAE